jgi:hypothetical protein
MRRGGETLEVARVTHVVPWWCGRSPLSGERLALSSARARSSPCGLWRGQTGLLIWILDRGIAESLLPHLWVQQVLRDVHGLSISVMASASRERWSARLEPNQINSAV